MVKSCYFKNLLPQRSNLAESTGKAGGLPVGLLKNVPETHFFGRKVDFFQQMGYMQGQNERISYMDKEVNNGRE